MDVYNTHVKDYPMSLFSFLMGFYEKRSGFAADGSNGPLRLGQWDMRLTEDRFSWILPVDRRLWQDRLPGAERDPKESQELLTECSVSGWSIEVQMVREAEHRRDLWK